MGQHANVDIIAKFFEAYGRQDLNGIRQVLSEDVTWTFPGQNPLSGKKVGVDEIVSFFNEMGAIMGRSNPEVRKLVMGEADDYVIECQRIRTHREDGVNLDLDLCVLWVFRDGKITEGKHFTSEPSDTDAFFNKVQSATQPG